MNFCECSPWEWQIAPMGLIGRERMLLLATAGGTVNGMTVAWGGLGVMWGMPCVYYAIRPSRFTHQLTEAGECVSLCALQAAYTEALTYFGTHSGREGDKFKAAGLNPITMPCGGVGVSGARLIVTAKKVFSHAISAGEIKNVIYDRWYKDEDLHTMYVAAVQAIYLAE